MIGVDWGTSSLRAYRLDATGAIVERREATLGIMQVQNQIATQQAQGAQFAAALESVVGDWPAVDLNHLVMSGMIGSRQGWKEAPYANCSAGERELAAGMIEVAWGQRRIRIVPGVTCRDASDVPDVMRGEETQIIGALATLGSGAHTICLPGTHSKWVTLRDGKIVAFSTHMTGEVFAMLKGHSILGRMMSEPTTDLAEFDRGVRRAGDAGGLLHHIFGTRTRGLMRELADDQSAHYLSGLLIGHEIASVRPVARVALLGAPQLASLYARALRVVGVEAVALDSDCAARGLWRLATAGT